MCWTTEVNLQYDIKSCHLWLRKADGYREAADFLSSCQGLSVSPFSSILFFSLFFFPNGHFWLLITSYVL